MNPDPGFSIFERDSPSARKKSLRRLLWSLSLKLLSAAVSLFFLLGVFAPNLVDRRQDTALALAVVCLAVSVAIVGWLATSGVGEIRRYLALRKSLIRLDRL